MTTPDVAAALEALRDFRRRYPADLERPRGNPDLSGDALVAALRRRHRLALDEYARLTAAVDLSSQALGHLTAFRATALLSPEECLAAHRIASGAVYRGPTGA